ncbi:MAG: type II toxin-antitoxin system prevent-host-death family antitoxin [Acidimicrobiia bacterium]|nr:type II toxin-antitoxin system prevent-host-death family antitoxin [Acidimicrobiia bacterium]
MAEVGVRELRDHLSRYLEQVQAGDEVIVTERGRAIARVVPINGERTIDKLIRQGLVTPARQRHRRRPVPLHAQGPVSDLVADQRR